MFSPRVVTIALAVLVVVVSYQTYALFSLNVRLSKADFTASAAAAPAVNFASDPSSAPAGGMVGGC